MAEQIYVASVVTKYDIARALFSDILFQHGIDKIYYYGMAPKAGDEGELVRYIDRKITSIDQVIGRQELCDPVHMVELACDLKSHIDLDYERYFRELEEAYGRSTDDAQRRALSRTIGLFKPYSLLEVPILDAPSLRVETEAKSLKDKLADLSELCRKVATSEEYGQYKKSVYDLGVQRGDPRRHLEKMKEILEEVIAVADGFSSTLGSLLKITRAVAFAMLDERRKGRDFNPLFIDLQRFHKQASLAALDRIIIRGH